jgi:hypothetical protein
MRPLLDFGTFNRIFEAQETASAYAPIFDLYFQIYSELAGKVEGYKDSASDLTDIGNSKIEEKPTTFGNIFKKIEGLIKDDKISGIVKNYYLPATQDLVAAYNAFLEKASDSEKEAAQKAVNDRVKDYLNKLISAAKEIKEGFSYKADDFLFEKQTFKDERASLARELVSLQGDLNSSIANPSSDKLANELKPLAKKSADLSKELSNDQEWEEMKRRKRKDRIEEIGLEISDMKNKRLEIMSQEVKNMGLDQTITKKIVAAQDKISKAAEESAKISQETINAEITKETGSGEDPEIFKELQKDFQGDGLKIKDFKEIKSGNVDVTNLKKKGKNREDIQKAQEQLNKFLPADEQIKPDGLYGKNTEEAIKKISSVMGLLNKDAKSEDGKSLTPSFRAVLNKAVEKGGPEKIKELMDKAKDKMKGNKNLADKAETIQKAVETVADAKGNAEPKKEEPKKEESKK